MTLDQIRVFCTSLPHVTAPYMARAGWVSVRDLKVTSAAEIKKGIRASYDYYYAKLPKKTQAALAAGRKQRPKGKI